MIIIAYTYEADIHCVACTERRFGGVEPMIDREGNEAHPVFSTDKLEPNQSCGTCRASIN